MAAEPKAKMTVEEYLEFDRVSEVKHEYYAGEVFAMAGGSKEHSIITMNIGASLHLQLRERPCTVFSSDQRVKFGTTELFTHPDITVVCGEAEFWSRQQDTLLNPTLIVEVLSPSTESDDRGDKFTQYRVLDSLREYVLVSQQTHQVERYLRQEGIWWGFSAATGLAASIELPSIGCTLALADVYAKVRLAAAEGGRFGAERRNSAE